MTHGTNPHVHKTDCVSRAVACVGDVRDVATHSGAAHFLWYYGVQAGFIQDGWQIDPTRYRFQRLRWNLSELATTSRYGGFQYTNDFLGRIERDVRKSPDVSEVISLHPLFPRISRHPSLSVSFYLDATLHQVFHEHCGRKMVSPRIVEQALTLEKAQYQSAARIICWSKWAAQSVINDYDIDSCKVFVVPCGPSIYEDQVPAVDPIQKLIEIPLRLGFVGKDWRRKNLPFLLRVAEELSLRGISTEVIAAGFDPSEGPSHELLRSVGFIDKRNQMDEYIEFVRSFHFGCLFSKAEPFGLSNIECLRLGVPILTWDREGISSTFREGLGHLFQYNASPEEVARTLQMYVRNPHAYALLRETVTEAATSFSWTNVIQAFCDIWDSGQGNTKPATL